MTIDISHDKLLDFAAATRLLPPGSRPSYTTWWRWCRRGVRGVKLETVLLGGRRYTSEAAMKDFVAAITSRDAGQFPAACSPQPRQRDRREEAELRKWGIL